MQIKRYQRWTREGLKWSKWFLWRGGNMEQWQLRNKQLNEYKVVSEEEWKKMKKIKNNLHN